jgi:hypothetical protein
MRQDPQEILDSYKQGVIDAVKSFEKQASFQSWMQNPKFREKFAERVSNLIDKVRGNPTAD